MTNTQSAIARLRELRNAAGFDLPIHAIEAHDEDGLPLLVYEDGDAYAWNMARKEHVDAIVAAMNSLPALLDAASQLEKLTEAASCIRHWHDAMADGSGMVVSAEHVRKLWDATEQARAALQALAEGGGE